RQDLRSQICHSLPGGLASATAGGGSRARKVCWLLFRFGLYVLRVFGRGLWLFPYLVLCSSAVSSLWWSLSTVAIFCVVLLRAPTKQRYIFLFPS
ncbi:unnamed protein product, partial [Brassica napus]